MSISFCYNFFVKVAIITHPNSKKPRTEKDLLGSLHVYVSEPPLEGKANQAVIKSLAEYFKVKKNQVRLLSGEKSKNKIVEIE
ncbi:DUF167 domain-containing protein [Candidatus Microgenomates bacterium]|nr:MAG: DUF167 domain-containing protein [Candidatus Microgenomates bacterium]